MTKNNTRNHKSFMKKLSAGLMASLCALSVIGSSVTNIGITASAAMTTENTAFPSADAVIAQAATLLGSPTAGDSKDIQVYTIRTAILRFPLTMSDSRALTALDSCIIPSHTWLQHKRIPAGTILFLWILRTGCQ